MCVRRLQWNPRGGTGFDGEAEKNFQALNAQRWNILSGVISLKNAIASKDELAMKNLLPRFVGFHQDAFADRYKKEHPDEDANGLDAEITLPWLKLASQNPKWVDGALKDPLILMVWLTQFFERFLSRSRMTYWVKDGTSELQPASCVRTWARRAWYMPSS